MKDSLSIDMNYPINIKPTPETKLLDMDLGSIPFGKFYSDHMFMTDYIDGAWQEFNIVPFNDFPMNPATSALHYGQAIFEGMKAYKDQDGRPQLFRPEMNIDRFNRSAKRMAMPEVPEELFMSALHELIYLDQSWIPTMEGSALYIRPFMIATTHFIGVKPAEHFKFVIFTCPVGPYYTHPVKVKVAEKYVRAFHGGVGSAKAAGNYGATMAAVKEANAQGYDQMLWMDGEEFKYIHEIGTMNVFFVVGDKVLTPELSDTILDGVTRNSVIEILKEKQIPIEERAVSIDEIYSAYQEGNLKEVFGAGTAATIAHISDIGYHGKNLELPALEDNAISKQLYRELEDIKCSVIDDNHGWIVKVQPTNSN